MVAGFNKAVTAIDSGNTDNLKWPAASFPSGFPVYPDGEIIYSESYFDDDLMVFITETSKASYDNYINTLKSNGWLFDAPEDGVDFAVKGSWMLCLMYDEEYGVGIYIADTGIDFGDLYGDTEWPDIPVAIPVYPDGNFAFVTADKESDFYSITVFETSKATMDKYLNGLAGAGWTREENGDLSLSVEGEGTWYLSLSFDSSDNSVFIGLFLVSEIEYDGEGIEFTGWSNDEFTRQIPKPDFKMTTAGLTEETFMAVFYDITVPVVKEYAEKVKAAGFTTDGKVTEETAKTYCYTASNDKGYSINLRLFDGGTMYITMSK